MAAIILVLLFSAGVLAQHQPPLALKFRQDSSDTTYRSPADLARQISVEKHQDDSAFASGSDSGLGTNQITVKSEVQSTNEDIDNADSGCDFPFVKIGTSCYFFSSEQLNFADAEDYCESLSHGHTFTVNLAMMEYDNFEDQALLDAVTERSNTFWIGGSTEDGVNWSWLDDRPISLRALFWMWGEPNTPANKCANAQVKTQGDNIRSYIYDSECSVSLNFICQTRSIFPDQIFEFRKIGREYYFLSEEVGLPYAPWQTARNYCKDLLVPVGYHSDLAVLTMTQEDYELMYDFFPADTTGNYYAWIGAVTDDDACTFKFIDGRSLPSSSTYWEYTDPTCVSGFGVTLKYYATYDRTLLNGESDSISRPFICQMYRDE